MSETEEILDVDLGFAEEKHPDLLTNRYFPSKIGGKPAWLELENIPKIEDLACPKCSEPCTFLMQVYAPIETDPDCFHRTIYVFICKNGQCFQQNSSENIIVFRSQIRRQNRWYDATPPSEDTVEPAIEPPVKICHICGCYGPLSCSKCKQVTYCGKTHQKIDWKSGHKEICDGKVPDISKTQKTVLFPEFEIVIEGDNNEEDIPETAETEEEAETRRQKEFEKLVEEGKAGNMSELSETELAKYVDDQMDDKLFRKFKKKVDMNPDQILRYQRGGEPLWITDHSPEQTNVANCERCGAKRIFEFQVMPQLLNYIKDEDMDWGVLLVYTCSKSCDPKNGYVREVVVKQDIVEKESEQPIKD